MRKNRCKNRSCEHVNIVNITPRYCICFVKRGRNCKTNCLPETNVHNVHMFTGHFWAFLRQFGAFMRHFGANFTRNYTFIVNLDNYCEYICACVLYLPCA